LFIRDVRKKFPFKNNEFDFIFSLVALHNFNLHELEITVKEINRILKKQYIMAKSYRNEKELFNLQCWILTAESFLNPYEWKWFFKYLGYRRDIEFIYFK